MITETLPKVSIRQQQIVKKYLAALDEHIHDLKNGVAQKTLEVKDFADELHIHPRHLSNTIQQVLGVSPCSIYENKLMDVARALLLDSNLSISDVARQLTYDPSNFTKFFKHFEGITPKKFREKNILKN